LSAGTRSNRPEAFLTGRIIGSRSVNFHVHAMIDDHLLKVAAKTARDVFAKAIEWHVVGRLTNISISDGSRSYSIAEFALVMALVEMASTEASATRNGPDANKAIVE
jgi:hypothetical protein